MLIAIITAGILLIRIVAQESKDGGNWRYALIRDTEKIAERSSGSLR